MTADRRVIFGMDKGPAGCRSEQVRQHRRKHHADKLPAGPPLPVKEKNENIDNLNSGLVILSEAKNL